MQIRDKKLRLRFNLNHLRSSDEHELWLPNVQVSDGQWHTVRVLRHGSTASISLDGGGGRRYNELLEYEGQHQLMMIEKQNVIAGGDVQYVGPGVTVVDNDFQEGTWSFFYEHVILTNFRILIIMINNRYYEFVDDIVETTNYQVKIFNTINHQIVKEFPSKKV